MPEIGNSEIIISSPSKNKDQWRGVTRPEKEFKEIMAKIMEKLEITPANYPRAADLAAGNGGVADFLIGQGWKAADVTCIDRAVPDPNLAPDSRWQYFDLNALGEALKTGGKIPEEVLRLKESFDLVCFISAFDISYYFSRLANFFLQPGGVSFVNSHQDSFELDSERQWEKLGGFSFFYKKS